MIIPQPVLPAISTYQTLKKFLQSSLEYGIIVDFQLAELEDVVHQFKTHNKKVIVHIDMIRGLTANEYGAIYLIQSLGVDGIISTKSSVIEQANKRDTLSIQRLFLKDSYSLKRGIQVMRRSRPDWIEVLPAVRGDIIADISKQLSIPIICGGLIKSKDQIQTCFDAGASTVSTSNPELWDVKP